MVFKQNKKQKLFDKIKLIRNKNLAYTLLVFALVIIGLSYSKQVYAFDIAQYALDSGISVITWICKVFISLFGKLLILIFELIKWLSLYNNFINSQSVIKGWRLLRDFINMFFILGLLLIAFATVLGVEKYSWTKLLPRLLFMAIAINFSRTICGIIIDFFQLIMLTFVKGYDQIMAGNMFSSFGVTNWFKADVVRHQTDEAAGNAKTQGIDYMVSSILGLMYILISCVVLAIFAIVLAIRIIALWILIMFSPFAFFAYSFEATGGKIAGFSKQWWGEFFNYCVIGPCLAFFLWFSVAIVSPTLSVNPSGTGTPSADWGNPSGYIAQDDANISFSKGGSIDALLKFIISISLLVGGLVFCSKFKTAASGAMMKGTDFIKKQSIGRLESGARRAGSLASKGAVATAGVAATAAALPYTRLARPGVKALQEKAYRSEGKWKYASGRNLAEKIDVGKERMYSWAAGTPREVLSKRTKQAEGMSAELRKTQKYEMPVEKSRGMRQAFQSGDIKRGEALLNMQASEGTLTQADMGFFKNTDYYQGLGDNDRKYYEKYERMNEEKKGSRITGGGMRFDPQTGDQRQVSTREEVYTAVANAPKDKFTNFASKKDFMNIGYMPGYLAPGMTKGEQSVFEGDIKREQFDKAAGEIDGATVNTQNVAHMPEGARKNKVKAIDFLLSSQDKRETLINTGQTKDYMEDIYRPQEPGESTEQYHESAKKFYKDFDDEERDSKDAGNADDMFLNEARITKMHTLREAMSAPYEHGQRRKDAEDNPIAGQGLGAIAKGDTNENYATIVNDVKKIAVGPPKKKKKKKKGEEDEEDGGSEQAPPGPEPGQAPPGPEPGQAPPGPEPGQAPPGPEPGQAPPSAESARPEAEAGAAPRKPYTPQEEIRVINQATDNLNIELGDINNVIQAAGLKPDAAGRENIDAALARAVSQIQSYIRQINSTNSGLDTGDLSKAMSTLQTNIGKILPAAQIVQLRNTILRLQGDISKNKKEG